MAKLWYLTMSLIKTLHQTKLDVTDWFYSADTAAALAYESLPRPRPDQCPAHSYKPISQSQYRKD